MRRAARLAMTVLVVASPILGVAAPAALVPAASAATVSVDSVLLNGFEARLAVEINDARRSAGLRPLQVVPGTTDVARRWAWRLAGDQRLWHNPSLVSDLSAAGSSAWTDIAENVGYGPAQQPHTLFTAYMNSPEHRANILDRSARYLGVGVVERDGVAYNTLDFTDAYATSYGDTRVPAAGLTMDETSITATTDVAQFESRDDQRFTNRSRGSIHAARIRFTGPTAGNDSAYTVLQPTKGGPGRGGIVMRTALDLSQASGISLQASAHDPRSRPVHATVLLRRSFGGSVRVGTVTLNGHCAWTDLSLPDAARDFRDTLVLQIPAKAVRAAGGRVRLDLFDVRASA